MTDSTLEQVKRSVYAACLALFPDDDLTSYYFDGLMANTQMPTGDLVGIRELVLTRSKPCQGNVMIGFVTDTDDTNLARLDNYVGVLFDTLVEDYKISLLDSDNSVVGQMSVLADATVSPRFDTQTRPVKFVAFGFVTTIW